MTLFFASLLTQSQFTPLPILEITINIRHHYHSIKFKMAEKRDDGVTVKEISDNRISKILVHHAQQLHI